MLPNGLPQRSYQLVGHDICFCIVFLDLCQHRVVISSLSGLEFKQKTQGFSMMLGLRSDVGGSSVCGQAWLALTPAPRNCLGTEEMN